MYTDTDFWVALLKDDDWLAERATELLDRHRGDLEVSLVTFVELFLIEERYAFDRERAVTSILELAAYDGDEDVIYRASEYVDDGLHTFDAFHAARCGGELVSSDGAFDGIGVERVSLDPEDQQ